MDIRPLLQLSTVLLAVGALGYYGYGNWSDEVVATNDGSGPDYIVEQMQGWQTDDQGKLLRRFDGSQLIHRPQPELFEVRQPNIRLYSNGKPLWQLTAAQATSTDPGADVWLQGNVVAVRDASQGSPLRIETRRLHANPHANLLDTPERVRITGPQGQMSGTGMKTDLQAKTLQFTSAVEVHYAPSR